MAGIGFTLRAPPARSSLIEPSIALARGSVIAAGPWIFTVVAIAMMHQATARILPQQDGHIFRGFVIYAFAISLFATAPVVNVAIRQVVDDIYLGDFDQVRPRFSAALLLSAILSGLAAVVTFALILRIPSLDLVVAIAGTTAVGLIWPAMAFCGAVRDYSGITSGFGLGLVVSVVATVSVAHAGWGPKAMMAAFTSGLGVVFFALASRVIVAFPTAADEVSAHLKDLLRGFVRYWMLALGSAAAIASLWSDKWVMWFGPHGVALENGLVSAPFYDGPMFVAYLVMIPVLGLFVNAIETRFIDVYQRYYQTIRGKGTLARIVDARASLEKQAFLLISRVLVTQAVLCAVVVMAAPALISTVGLQFQQIGVLRFGMVATLFQFLFLACTSVLLFLDRHGRFLVLQLIFLVCQVAFTQLTMWLGIEYYGFGHLAACAVASVAAAAVLDRTFCKLDYLTFSAAVRQAQTRRSRSEGSSAVAGANHRSSDISLRFPTGRSRPLLAREDWKLH